MNIEKLGSDNMHQMMQEFLELEYNWDSVGEPVWSESNFKLDLPGKSELSFYIEIDGKMGGYLIGSRDKDVGKLNKIMTDSSLRGRGLGTKLWEKFLEQARKNNLRKLEFKVLTDNEIPKLMYKKKGCLFDGISLGSDGKERDNIHYIFRSRENIPHSKPTIDESDVRQVSNTIISGNLVGGDKSKELISALEKYTGNKFGVGTNSGSNAIFLALRALGIEEGDEVILPSYCCGSILHPLDNLKVKPIFADVKEDDFSISYEEIVKNLSCKTQAIIVPHMFGKVASDIQEMRDSGIPIIEDCAQSLGAKYHDGESAGSIGYLSILSFYPTKLISSSYGGAILTNDINIHKRIENLVQNDNRSKWGEAHSMGLCDVSASMALNQVGKLEDFLQRRREIAGTYNELLEDSEFILPNFSEGDVFFRYVVKHEEAKDIINSLNRRGISARKPVFKPLHRYLNQPDTNFPNTVELDRTAISIPIYPSLEREQIREVAGALLDWRYER